MTACLYSINFQTIAFYCRKINNDRGERFCYSILIEAEVM